jgi:hypothetical protein
VRALGLTCAPGTEPSLLHLFIGKFADSDASGAYGDDGMDKTYSLAASTTLVKGFDVIVPAIEDETGLVNVAYSSGPDPDPAGPYPVVRTCTVQYG